MSKKILTGTAPDGTTVTADAWGPPGCGVVSDDGRFICTQPGEGHGPWHIASAGSYIASVWAAGPAVPEPLFDIGGKT